MGSPVIHFEIATKNLAKSKEFYSKLFGWKIAEVEGMGYNFVETDSDDGISGGMFQAPEGTHGFVTTYIEVDSVSEKLKDAKKLGAKVMMEAKRVRSDLEVGLFHDLDGLVIGLMDRNPG